MAPSTPAPARDSTTAPTTVTSKYYDTYGYAQKFTMEVHSGIITKVQFAETSAAGTLRTAIDATWRQTITDSDNYKDLGDIYQVLTTSLIKKQQSDGIDTVSGATRTCESFKNPGSHGHFKQQEG